MFRILIVVVFAAAGSTGGIWGGLVYAAFQKDAKSDEPPADNAKSALYLTPEIFVVPVLENWKLKAFLICRFAVGVDPAVPNISGIDDETILADLYYETAFNGDVYRAGQTRVPDASLMVDALLARANEVVGAKRFTNVLIQQVDLFYRTDVRRKVVEERLVEG